MRLLIINSNTSERVTDMVATAARGLASPTTDLVFATGSFGASVIASRTENAIAGHATVDLVAQHAHDCDGVLVAVSYDSGLRAARELLGLPVLGLTEASLLAALTLGTRVGLVVWGRGAISLYLEIIDSYGLGSRICGARKLDIDVPTGETAENEMNEAILRASNDLIERDNAEVIVLVGAVLSGRSYQLQDRLPVPVLDGVRCAVPMLEAMVRIGAKAPVCGSYSIPAGRETEGLSENLKSKLAQTR